MTIRIEYDSTEVFLAVTAEVDRTIRETSLAVLRSVVFATPVKTGRARGNWQTTLDAPVDGDLAITDKVGGATVSRGLVTISADLRSGDDNYRSVVIQNNLPYINRLNNGHSQQQSVPGFVERAIGAAIQSVSADREDI